MISFLGYTITQANESHFAGMAKILSYFVEADLSAEVGFFGGDAHIYSYLTQPSSVPIVVVLQEDIPVGFALLRHDCKAETFIHSAELSYFIMPNHTGKGLASAIFKILEERAAQLGIWNLFLAASSNRSDCFMFHKKMGFSECGRLPKVGYRNDHYFDIVYFHKSLISGK